MNSHDMHALTPKKSSSIDSYTAAGTLIKNSHTLELYFRDIANLKMLSSKEEIQLAKRIKKGDEKARNRLVTANLRFVIRVAKEHQNCGVPITDLISAGNLGLLKAAEQFDTRKGVKFITYAVWWIRQAIYQTLAQDSRSVRLPANRIDLLQKISKTVQVLHQEQETEPETEAIVNQLGVSADLVEDTIKWAQDVGSLDATIGEEGAFSLIDKLADTSESAPDTEVSKTSERTQIEKMLNMLDEREADVLRLYYGFDDEEPLSLQEIGDCFQLTRERIRQIKQKALQKLQQLQKQYGDLV